MPLPYGQPGREPGRVLKVHEVSAVPFLDYPEPPVHPLVFSLVRDLIGVIKKYQAFVRKLRIYKFKLPDQVVLFVTAVKESDAYCIYIFNEPL